MVAAPVGRKDVPNYLTSCCLFVGLVESKVIDFAEEGVADLLGVIISRVMCYTTTVAPGYGGRLTKVSGLNYG